MSFILDALKKSELERQRQSMPGLMDAPTSLRRGRLPLWAILLGSLLAINIVVLIVVLMRNGAASVGRPAAATSPGQNTSPADVKPAAVDEHFSPLSAAPVYAPEIPVPPAETSSASTASTAALVAPRAIEQRAAPHAFRRPDPVLTNEEATDNDEVLPSINEINLTGAQALPEMHLDVHVYATRPADRFVFINMRKYKEGNTLQEGPVLERIRRDGVVLNYQGLRFILPRQS
ncbi:MAG TPA: general secretion pathway protein GspB [Steroidobacteraceae bacterium]|jgi:general secretion pathway protein B|nr:general secretion pathway protein GspB [Steroidobacteraceae bacterium]